MLVITHFNLHKQDFPGFDGGFYKVLDDDRERKCQERSGVNVYFYFLLADELIQLYPGPDCTDGDVKLQLTGNNLDSKCFLIILSFQTFLFGDCIKL